MLSLPVFHTAPTPLHACMGTHARERWTFSFLLLIAEMKRGRCGFYKKKKTTLLMASGFEIHWSSGDCFQSAEMESFHCNNNIPYWWSPRKAETVRQRFLTHFKRDTEKHLLEDERGSWRCQRAEASHITRCINSVLMTSWDEHDVTLTWWQCEAAKKHLIKYLSSL